MNPMINNIRQNLKETEQYIRFLERENIKLRKQIKRYKNGKSKSKSV